MEVSAQNGISGSSIAANEAINLVGAPISSSNDVAVSASDFEPLTAEVPAEGRVRSSEPSFRGSAGGSGDLVGASSEALELKVGSTTVTIEGSPGVSGDTLSDVAFAVQRLYETNDEAKTLIDQASADGLEIIVDPDDSGFENEIEVGVAKSEVVLRLEELVRAEAEDALNDLLLGALVGQLSGNDQPVENDQPSSALDEGDVSDGALAAVDGGEDAANPAEEASQSEDIDADVVDPSGGQAGSDGDTTIQFDRDATVTSDVGTDPVDVIDITEFDAAATVQLGSKEVSIGRLPGVEFEDAKLVAEQFEDLYNSDDTFRSFIDSQELDDLTVVLTKDEESEILGRASVDGWGRMALNLKEDFVTDIGRLREVIVHEVAHWGGLNEAGAEQIEEEFRNTEA